MIILSANGVVRTANVDSAIGTNAVGQKIFIGEGFKGWIRRFSLFDHAKRANDANSWNIFRPTADCTNHPTG